jgi:hypothetical protein
MITSRVWQAVIVNDAAVGAVARTSVETVKAESLKRSKGLRTLCLNYFLINLAVTVAFSLLFVWLLLRVNQDGGVNTFDPFAILGIDTGSDFNAIKAAYRKAIANLPSRQKPGRSCRCH